MALITSDCGQTRSRRTNWALTTSGLCPQDLLEKFKRHSAHIDFNFPKTVRSEKRSEKRSQKRRRSSRFRSHSAND